MTESLPQSVGNWPRQATMSCGRAVAAGLKPVLELYDDALPHVYGYLLARCGSGPSPRT